MTKNRTVFAQVVTLVDWTAATGAILATTYLCIRHVDRVRGDWVNGTASRLVVYGIAALIVALGLMAVRRSSSVTRGIVMRVPLFALSGLLGLMAYNRNRVPVRHWPPRREDSYASRLSELNARQRADWGARVAMHRVTTQPPEKALTIPRTWSFPADISIAVEHPDAERVRVWARTGEGVIRCVALPDEGLPTAPAPIAAMPDAANPVDPHAPAHDASSAKGSAPPTGCAKGVAPPALAQFIWPPRVAEEAIEPVTTVAVAPWPEYRHDAGKSAIAVTSNTGTAWKANLDSQIRASFSIVGNLALIGAHGSGTLAAFDVATGEQKWLTRVPNWIHQDVVSDGRIAVVGFGDNTTSMFGLTPSGVAAFEVATGRHLWTRFDESSVMTSPVLRDSILVYSSASGVLRKRLMATGDLLDEKILPGGVIMGPPTSVGDTLVLGLDQESVCAMLISSLKTLWCHATPFHSLTGHSAPSVANGIVISTTSIRGRGLTFREFVSLPWPVMWDHLRSIIRPNYEPAGQKIEAYRLTDGKLLWSSHLFAELRKVRGHNSGTAAIHDSIGVMVLPNADSIAAFKVSTGDILWTAGAHASRGPPLLLQGFVVNSGRDGITQILELNSGKLRCSIKRAVGYDRAGPANAGGALLFADLNGGLEAIPASSLINCDTVALSRL